MPSDAYREARAAAKAARSAAKQARERARLLRPWYFKKRFILGVPLLLALGVVVAVGALSMEGGRFGPDADDDGDSAEGIPGASATAVELARIGAIVRVGSIDLTILQVDVFDGRSFNPANDVNFRVLFRATNTRGPASEEYRLTDAAFQLVDESGALQSDGRATCQGCPDNVAGGTALARGATFEGAVYFRIPSGQPAAELRYQSPNSTNRARVALR